MNVPVINRQNEIIVNHLKKYYKKGNLLELCCGEGKNINILANSNCYRKALGVDFSKQAIKIARQKRIKNAEFIEKNIFDFAAANKFDIVMCLMALEHFRDDKAASKKICSFVKSNGLLIVSVPAHTRLYSNQDKHIGHYRRYDRQEIIRLFKKHGFRLKKMYTIGFPVANIYTFFYNLYLKSMGKNELRTESTKKSGIQKMGSNFIMRLGNLFIFPILSKLIKIDKLFLNTDIGTHYIIIMQQHG